jgi:hypothetical protein
LSRKNPLYYRAVERMLGEIATKNQLKLRGERRCRRQLILVLLRNWHASTKMQAFRDRN